LQKIKIRFGKGTKLLLASRVQESWGFGKGASPPSFGEEGVIKG